MEADEGRAGYASDDGVDKGPIYNLNDVRCVEAHRDLGALAGGPRLPLGGVNVHIDNPPAWC